MEPGPVFYPHQNNIKSAIAQSKEGFSNSDFQQKINRPGL